MQSSLFLARLIGPFFLLVGLGVLFNRAAVRAVVDELSHNRALVFFGGLITLPAGLAIVLTHNVWVANWPLLITLIGWLAAVTGAVRLLAPHNAIKFGRQVYDQPNGAVIAASIWVAIGAILCFFGYVS
jgi:hypothetical protein